MTATSDAGTGAPEDGAGVLRIGCLGPLQAAVDGGSIPLGGPRQRLVLAHLLIRANRTVPADRLITEVWEDPPASARGTLQTYISHLRKALGADRITSDGAGYALQVKHGEVDRHRFEDLAADGRKLRATDPTEAAAVIREALDLWRGPPFADLADAPSLQPEITRLTEARLAALEERIAADLDAGRATELVGELEALTAEHPLRERLWQLLMVALYRTGRQGDALAAYDRIRRRLADELGVDPSAALAAVHARVLRHDPALSTSGPTLRGYRLRERIGDGTFGVVWRATQPGTDREVVVKVARPALANDPDFIRRFEADAQRVASIEHPHVVPLYDFWREPDGAYLVERYLRGGSVGDLLDRADPPDRGHALRIAEQVSHALAAAHRAGVVHGRVTPSTILLDADGDAYLSGLVAARHAGGDRWRHAPAPTADDTALADAMAADVEALQRVLATLVGDDLPSAQADHGAEQATRGTARVVRNPYKGLRPFAENDADDFFGRDAIVQQLLARLREGTPDARFLALVGPSGSGKSSIVRAGVISALRRGAIAGSERWFVAAMVPGERPFDELATALRHVAVDAPDDLAADIARDGLSSVVRTVLPAATELLLVIDQFEELFTLADVDRRQRFIDTVVEAVTAADDAVRVLLTVRADFYDRPLAHHGLARLMRSHTETVVPLGPEDIAQTVTRPAARAGLDVEPALVAQIVADVVDQPGALPLLQYALTELVEHRDDGVLTTAAYHRIGGVAGALARRAEAIHTAFTHAEREATRQLLLRLVSTGEGAEDTRRRAGVADVTALAPDVMPLVLDAFGSARLLSFDRDPETRAPTVEVAHEALLREWSRLRSWIDTARDDLRTQRRLQAAATDWTAADREPSYLAMGAQLAQYETWAASSDITSSALEGDYLRASVAARDQATAEEASRHQRELDLERRSVRRLRTLVAVLGAAALVAGVLTVVAITQGRRAADEALRAAREARVATARELAAAADANLAVDPERSMLLAIDAIDVTRSAGEPVLRQAEEALHRAVGASRIVRRFPGVGGALDWSPDGRTFITEGPEDSGIIDIRDAETGASIRSWRGHDVDINFVTFSDDGALLATSGDDGAVWVWDPTTGQRLAGFDDQTGVVLKPSFDTTGARVAVASPDKGWIKVIDIASGRVIAEPTSAVTPGQVAMSPDGDRVAVASDRRPQVTVYDALTGEELHALEGGDAGHLSLAWSPDGRHLAAGSVDGTTMIWDARSGDVVATPVGHTAAVYDLAWNSDASTLVSGGLDGTATVWDVTEGGARRLLSIAADHTTSGVAGVAFSPDDRYLMVGDAALDAITIWDIDPSGGAESATWPTSPRAPTPVRFVDGHRVVSSDEGALVLRDDRNVSELLRIDPRDTDEVTISALDASSDGRLIAGAIHFDRPAAGAEKPGDRAPTLGPIGDLWEAVPAARRHAATVWDARTGAERISVPHPAWITDVVVSDGVLASADSGGTVKVTDLSGDQVAVLREEPGHAVVAIALSPDGRLLAAAGVRNTPASQRVRVWDVTQQQVVHTIGRDAAALTFTPDGARLVTAHQDGDAHVWDTRSWKRVTTFQGHAGPVLAVDAAPDGRTVATTGTDGTTHLWDPASGLERLTLQGDEESVHSVAFSDDGMRLVTGDIEGITRVWALDLDDLIGIAKDKLTRELTDAECREYLHLDACPPR